MSGVATPAGVDPVRARTGAGRWRAAWTELGVDRREATRWYRRGRLVTGPLVPQILRRWLLVRGGVDLGPGVCGMERCWFQSSRISIGAETYVNAGCWFEGDGTIVIGSYALLGPEVMVLTSTHARGAGGRVSLTPEDQEVRIGSRCWLGARTTVLPGVVIGDDVVVAAGAVVADDLLEPGTYGGVPARRLR